MRVDPIKNGGKRSRRRSGGKSSGGSPSGPAAAPTTPASPWSSSSPSSPRTSCSVQSRCASVSPSREVSPSAAAVLAAAGAGRGPARRWRSGPQQLLLRQASRRRRFHRRTGLHSREVPPPQPAALRLGNRERPGRVDSSPAAGGAGGAKVVVSPGFALDRLGEEIDVRRRLLLPLPTKGSALFVLLRYAERPCRAVPVAGKSGRANHPPASKRPSRPSLAPARRRRRRPDRDTHPRQRRLAGLDRRFEPPRAAS